MISWRLVLIAGSLLTAFGGGYYVAGLQEAQRAADLAEQQQTVLDAARDRADKAEQLAAETRAKVETREKVVTRDVIKYVQDPNRTVCQYDSERVRIKQAILQAVDPRSDIASRTVPVSDGTSSGQ